jgi:phosphate-selective porin OprO and OprP
MFIFKYCRACCVFIWAYFFFVLPAPAQQSDSLQIITGTFADDSFAPAQKDSSIENVKTSKIINSLTNRVINVKKGKSVFQFKYGGRVQTRFDYIMPQETDAEPIDKLWLRRARLKSSGYLFTKKLDYKFELNLLNGQILDAYLKWNFYKKLSLWVGQTKLRGNRERVISSQDLQFVDRSLLNSKYNLDRDLGIWLSYEFSMGRQVLKEVFSVSKGEGTSIWDYNPRALNEGLDYTLRFDYLPLGEFKNNGDFIESDLEWHTTPKLAIGLTLDYNNNAVKSNGQTGTVLEEPANIGSWIVDMMFKYKGISVLAEFVDREIMDNDDLSTGPPDQIYTDYLRLFYTGTGLNTQAGYLFKSNYEIAARYSQVRPVSNEVFQDLTEYTFAFSKYIVGQKIKAQTDFSYLVQQNSEGTFIYRLQFELSF